jgi:flagellar protein FliS
MTPDNANRYQEVQVRTSTPIELVVLLYDVAVANIKKAQEYMAARDIAGRTRCLNKAISMLTELHAHINFELGGDLAKSLDRLYRYIKNMIFQANLHQDPARLREIVRLLSSLREAWLNVVKVEAQKTSGSQAESEAPSGAATLPMAANRRAASPTENLNITA